MGGGKSYLETKDQIFLKIKPYLNGLVLFKSVFFTHSYYSFLIRSMGGRDLVLGGI